MRLALAAIAALGVAAHAHAEVVREMTPEKIKEAIAWGTSAKEIPFPEIMSGTKWAWKSQKTLWGTFSTPYLRVAAAANSAKKKYKAFAETDVVPEMIAPELHVYGLAVPLGGTRIANVETVVITKKGEKDRSKAIQPTRAEPLSAEYQNLFGAKTEGKSLLAVFPLEVLQEGYEVHVVYDKKTPVGNVGGCEDCTMEFKLEKVK